MEDKVWISNGDGCNWNKKHQTYIKKYFNELCEWGSLN
jgi:hypothetical protein